MKWWPRLRGRVAPRAAAASPGLAATDPDARDALHHLREFATSRRGVEMYVEPRTSVTPTTVVLIATTGEWTRRRISGPPAAAALARDLRMPIYDVQLTGYPQRMRDWNARQRRAAGERGAVGD